MLGCRSPRVGRWHSLFELFVIITVLLVVLIPMPDGSGWAADKADWGASGFFETFGCG